MREIIQFVNCQDFTLADLNMFQKFDVMIVDPPYSEHVHKNATSQSKGRGTRHRDLGFDCLSPKLRVAILKAAATVERWSLIYSDVEGLGAWLPVDTQLGGASYIRTIPWIRWSMPQLSGDRPPQGFEVIACFHGSQKGRKHWNGPGNLTHLAHKCLRGEGKHKAEKPLDQMMQLVQFFSDPGECVLDPCAGSGTLGLACRLLGRAYVGFEIDFGWAEKANIRISEPKLSERDEERYQRWLVADVEVQAHIQRTREHTAKVRAKLDQVEVEGEP